MNAKSGITSSVTTLGLPVMNAFEIHYIMTRATVNTRNETRGQVLFQDDEFDNCRGIDKHGGAIYVDDSETVFTVLRSKFSGCSTNKRGGGIYSILVAEMMIMECQFANCESGKETNSVHTSSGGGVYCYSHQSSAVLESCVVSQCTGKFGGGFDIQGMEDTLNGVTINNCEFLGCSASPYSSGGVEVGNTKKGTKITECTFRGNTAYTNGGGLYVKTSTWMKEATDGQTPKFITFCFFHENKADEKGHDIFIRGEDVTATPCYSSFSTTVDGTGEGRFYIFRSKADQEKKDEWLLLGILSRFVDPNNGDDADPMCGIDKETACQSISETIAKTHQTEEQRLKLVSTQFAPSDTIAIGSKVIVINGMDRDNTILSDDNITATSSVQSNAASTHLLLTVDEGSLTIATLKIEHVQLTASIVAVTNANGRLSFRNVEITSQQQSSLSLERNSDALRLSTEKLMRHRGINPRSSDVFTAPLLEVSGGKIVVEDCLIHSFNLRDTSLFSFLNPTNVGTDLSASKTKANAVSLTSFTVQGTTFTDIHRLSPTTDANADSASSSGEVPAIFHLQNIKVPISLKDVIIKECSSYVIVGSYALLSNCASVTIDRCLFNGTSQKSGGKLTTSEENSIKSSHVGSQMLLDPKEELANAEAEGSVREVCGWEGSVVLLVSCTGSVTNTEMTLCKDGALSIKGGSVVLKGNDFHDNDPGVANYPSARRNVVCSGDASFDLQSVGGGDGAGESVSHWILDLGCNMKGIASSCNSTLFVPVLKSVERKYKSSGANEQKLNEENRGNELFSMASTGIKPPVAEASPRYELTFKGKDLDPCNLTFNVIVDDFEDNGASAVYVTEFQFLKFVGEEEAIGTIDPNLIDNRPERAEIRAEIVYVNALGVKHFTDPIVLIARPPKKSKTGLIVGLSVGIPVLVIVVVVCIIITVCCVKKKKAKKHEEEEKKKKHLEMVAEAERQPANENKPDSSSEGSSSAYERPAYMVSDSIPASEKVDETENISVLALPAETALPEASANEVAVQEVVDYLPAEPPIDVDER
ncbi:uncharacterized protein MONOS_14770 [Monocercomonoides exilis]|uniref:uncharacterized protein n=1 Tax=Monocercomonoides exilis TaxID=2049356 RepID=UPI0035597B9C|nr:hypothetical protein MONOS_14770 [Monocercomonoides exilis]|eukprot:MONOS_14770.1-p1 / transcript=MONOS_14770.1 / gene=MONOS_14770 / organism=Monocercomonoides_exilis_PA203 / gene_product=unspecified product / transcript_product=unspecified product / location=Mono_scaffold01068:14530-17661(+) / protein_length=1043 / sequence_SO=supercontig / SO=protein_coding / is_pseudo=false